MGGEKKNSGKEGKSPPPYSFLKVSAYGPTKENAEGAPTS